KLKGAVLTLLAVGVLAGGLTALPHPTLAEGQTAEPKAAADPKDAPKGPGKDPKLQLPTGPMPELALAVMGKEGTILIHLRRPAYRQKTVNQGDPAVTYYELVNTLQMYSYDPAQVRVSDTKGTRIDPEKLPQLLKTEVVALVSMGGEVDPLHLR